MKSGELRLARGWIERWLPRLDDAELRAYLALAGWPATEALPGLDELAARFGFASGEALERALAGLERHGLLERLEHGGALRLHWRCAGPDGLHRALPSRPTVAQALAEHRAMVEQLLAVDAAGENEALEAEILERYPELRERRREQEAAGAPWRLWLEFAMFLIDRFERRYGELKRVYAPLFKESSAQLLRMRLAMVDRITEQVLAAADEILPLRGEGWIGGIDEEAFAALPRIRELAQRYGIGAGQIYLNTLEALADRGRAVVFFDDRGHCVDLRLPSTSGLEPREERLAFFRLDELSEPERSALSETIERVRQARERYRAHLVATAAALLADLQRRRRLGSLERALALAADRVNEALSLVLHEGDDPRSQPKPVTADELREALAQTVRPAAGTA